MTLERTRASDRWGRPSTLLGIGIALVGTAMLWFTKGPWLVGILVVFAGGMLVQGVTLDKLAKLVPWRKP